MARKKKDPKKDEFLAMGGPGPGGEESTTGVTGAKEPGPGAGPATLEEVARVMNIESRLMAQKLKVPLTAEEQSNLGKELAVQLATINRLKDELVSIKSHYKSQIDLHTQNVNSLSRVINEGAEWRDVECQEVKNFTDNSVKVIRMDTGELVSERTMTAGERQRGLDLKPEPDPGPGIMEATEGSGPGPGAEDEPPPIEQSALDAAAQ